MKVMAADQVVYVPVEEGDFPYVDGPLGRDAILFVFTELEAALKYREELVDEGAIKKDQLKIMSMKIQGLWKLVDELTVFAQEEYGSGFEIILHEPQEVNTSIYNSRITSQLN